MSIAFVTRTVDMWASKSLTGRFRSFSHLVYCPADQVSALRAATEVPIAVGFGISTPAQAAAVAHRGRRGALRGEPRRAQPRAPALHQLRARRRVQRRAPGAIKLNRARAPRVLALLHRRLRPDRVRKDGRGGAARPTGHDPFSKAARSDARCSRRRSAPARSPCAGASAGTGTPAGGCPSGRRRAPASPCPHRPA